MIYRQKYFSIILLNKIFFAKAASGGGARKVKESFQPSGGARPPSEVRSSPGSPPSSVTDTQTPRGGKMTWAGHKVSQVSCRSSPYFIMHFYFGKALFIFCFATALFKFCLFVCLIVCLWLFLFILLCFTILRSITV